MKRYKEYTAPWWRRLEKRLRFDDETKRALIGDLMRTKPLTLLFFLAAVAGVLFLLALAVAEAPPKNHFETPHADHSRPPGR